MTVFKAIAAVCVAFARTLGWLVGAAIAGAVLSVAGGMILVGIVRSAAGDSLDDSGAIPAMLVPTMVAHAAFLVIVSRAASTRALRFGLRQGVGIVLITALIAAVALGAGQLPQPLPFFVPIGLTAVLAWTPLVPAVAVGPVPWSLSKFATAVLASLPFLALTEVFGLIPQAAATAGEGFGFMEGGMIMWPLLGLHLWLASVTAALVSTVVYLPPRPAPATVFA